MLSEKKEKKRPPLPLFCNRKLHRNGNVYPQKQPPAQVNDGISPPFSHLEPGAQGQKRGKANQEKAHRHDSRQHDGCRVGKIQQVHQQVQQQEI